MPNHPDYWTLFDYSEWLDMEGLVVGDSGPDADERSHDELVQQFLKERDRPNE